jgi:NAD(P)-dependent dehydrogenase (short-subunit alcohol dehydrogenase family)
LSAPSAPTSWLHLDDPFLSAADGRGGDHHQHDLDHAYKGSPELPDYAATKGAIVALTRSLSQKLWQSHKIRVNAVAPGPIWTPLIPASFDEDHVASHGGSAPMGRAGQPDEVAPCYIFLASEQDSSYMSGQVLHPNGGAVVNG